MRASMSSLRGRRHATARRPIIIGGVHTSWRCECSKERSGQTRGDRVSTPMQRRRKDKAFATATVNGHSAVVDRHTVRSMLQQAFSIVVGGRPAPALDSCWRRRGNAVSPENALLNNHTAQEVWTPPMMAAGL